VVSIFVNGTFDVLHPGHIRLLNYAKSLGDRLFVAIDSDHRVKELKGQNRPINDAATRKEMLLALKSVDEVEVFDSDEELKMWINQIRPYIMVVGSDYRNKKVIGSEFAKNLVFYERISEYSSTNIIKQIQDLSNR
jgi:D-beta-D-heptose 7-phosphate kinase/D-beta-D-heptose 1-phosphate adenosyltransferase